MPTAVQLRNMSKSQRECHYARRRAEDGKPSMAQQLKKLLSRITRERYVDGKRINEIAYCWARKLGSRNPKCTVRHALPFGCDFDGMWQGKLPFTGGTSARLFFASECKKEAKKRHPRPAELIILETQLRYPN